MKSINSYSQIPVFNSQFQTYPIRYLCERVKTKDHLIFVLIRVLNALYRDEPIPNSQKCEFAHISNSLVVQDHMDKHIFSVHVVCNSCYIQNESISRPVSNIDIQDFTWLLQDFIDIVCKYGNIAIMQGILDIVSTITTKESILTTVQKLNMEYEQIRVYRLLCAPIAGSMLLNFIDVYRQSLMYQQLCSHNIYISPVQRLKRSKSCPVISNAFYKASMTKSTLSLISTESKELKSEMIDSPLVETDKSDDGQSEQLEPQSVQEPHIPVSLTDYIMKDYFCNVSVSSCDSYVVI